MWGRSSKQRRAARSRRYLQAVTLCRRWLESRPEPRTRILREPGGEWYTVIENYSFCPPPFPLHVWLGAMHQRQWDASLAILKATLEAMIKRGVEGVEDVGT